jgi:two-component system, NtrC family, nitrogen regulation response regulator GlnG
LHCGAAVFPVTLLADRFIRTLEGWFDIATANRVEIRIRDAGSLRAQIAWAETCAMLSVLRHPLLRPLIDYGVASTTTLFEAYGASGALDANPSVASSLVTHGSRFLAAHGIALDASLAEVLVRPIASRAGAPRTRPVGIALQPRRASDALNDLIAASLAGGTRTVVVAARRGMGLRTLQTLATQRARAEGYVPACPEALHRWPWLFEVLNGRHVCLVMNSGLGGIERGAAATLLASVAMRSARSHILLVCERGDRPGRGAIHLEPMGAATMTSMIYIDPDYGPSKDDLFDAARRAEGSPARFLAQLGVRAYDMPVAHVSTVHETPAPYTTGTIPSATANPTPAAPSRIGSVLWRASSRASQLEARGRHAAAGRLLDRAARVLKGRGEIAQAARCWLQLGWMARNRGVSERAQGHALQARSTDPSPAAQISAGCLTAVSWTDQLRFIEAEASLRSLAAAASAVNDEGLRQRCQLALARCLYWDQRWVEAIDAIEPLLTLADPESGCEAQLLMARALVARNDLPRALHFARVAAAAAGQLGDLRLRAAASRAIAEALCTAGDLDGVRLHVAAGLEAAGAAHLPLLTLRLRAVLARALGRSAPASSEATQVKALLAKTRRVGVPALVNRILDEVCAPPRAVQISGTTWTASRERVTVEDFLETAQRGKDDGEAVARVAQTVCDRVAALSCAVVAANGQVIGVAGKQWRDRCVALLQARTSGTAVAVDSMRQPPEAAEPIRCGGDLIGAIGCRWIVGAPVVPALVSATLHAAGIALATHLRAIVESAALEPPPSVWGDLLGDSPVATTLRESIHRAARAPFPVLIEGESGSGKELVARAIHRLSPRHLRKFCALNCAALSDELVEAELFGHTRGAFTGAATERAGLFEEADGGTLFLDEVGELSARAQAKLLRVLQEGEVRRVGENLPRRVDVRIVAATNRRLEHEAAGGRFRVDLRFRLDVLRILVPPLRERPGDIALLAQHFWRQATSRVGSNAVLGPDALTALARHDWPGNVRELQNAIAWLAVHAPKRGRVSANLLPGHFAASGAAGAAATNTFEAAREEFERRFVRAALAQAGGQRQVAARALGMSRQGLAKMIRRLRIEP